MKNYKKTLIITYYWPPAGGAGVQRWLHFVKHLTSFEIEPVVFIPKSPHYPIVDSSLLKEINPKVKIITSRFFEPYHIASLLGKKEVKKISSGIIPTNKQSIIQKILLWIRGNLFVPDARIFWVTPAVKKIKKLIPVENIDAVITSGPPHSLHLIGLGLKKYCSFKWIADFRDPWTDISYQQKLKLTHKAILKHKKLEKKILQTADEIVVTSFTTAKKFAQHTPKPITTITNGFEPKTVHQITLDKKFTLTHIGSLLSERNPKVLWKVLADLKKEDSCFKKDLEIQLIGLVSEEVIQSMEASNLSEHLTLKGYMPHAEIGTYQRKTQVLLLIEAETDLKKEIIPGKLFEYLATQRPILAIGPKNWDVSQILAETQSVRSYCYTEAEALKSYIQTMYQCYKKDLLSPKTIDVSKYSRRNITKQMADLIKK